MVEPERQWVKEREGGHFNGSSLLSADTTAQAATRQHEQQQRQEYSIVLCSSGNTKAITAQSTTTDLNVGGTIFLPVLQDDVMEGSADQLNGRTILDRPGQNTCLRCMCTYMTGGKALTKLHCRFFMCGDTKPG